MHDQPTRAPKALTTWFSSNRRELPWRTPSGVPRDPWATLVSEVMSQQTRLEVVIPRFRSWMERWPSPQALATAPEEDVLGAWAGLGYYSRARNLRRAAQAIAGSGWTHDAGTLARLPGVGPYTAAAVSSLAFGEQVAMVDGNVLRVLSRVHALKDDLRAGKGAKLLSKLADAWIEGRDAGLVNEATMELGALVCAPRNPRCDTCPLAGICRACLSGDPAAYPARRARRETVDVPARIAVVRRGDDVLLRTARSGELLEGHRTLPEIGMLPKGFATEDGEAGVIRHAITHHRIVWTVVRCTARSATAPRGMEWCPASELDTRLVSSLPRKALAKAGIAVG